MLLRIPERTGPPTELSLGRENGDPAYDKKVILDRSFDTYGRILCIDYDKTVPHRHCEIIKEGSEFYLVNHSQSNGTLLDGYRVTNRVSLPSGSIIKMDRVEMRVSISF